MKISSLEEEIDAEMREQRKKELPILLCPKEAAVLRATQPKSILFRMTDLLSGQTYDLLLTAEQTKQIAEATDKLLQ
jgi:hypothetical protein